MSQAPNVIDNTLAPVASKMRIQALDVIRGLSILGILAVNADGFAAPMMASLKPAAWPFPNTGATALSYWVMDAFFHDKFVTLFSMLFGVSLFLVGGERGDKAKGRILWRRLAALFGFAMLHGFGIWWGDILSLYACTGVLMTFCRSWRPKTLLVVGLVLFASLTARPLIAIAEHAGHPAQAAHATMTGASEAKVVAVIADARGSWAGAYRQNTRSYLHLLSVDPWLVPSTLGLMMIGLSLFKSGFLSARKGAQVYWSVLGLGAAALGGVAWITWRDDVLMHAVPDGALMGALLALPVSLAYASGLILLLRSAAAPLLRPLAAAGRMAFTNYLTQSLIMTSIFYGGRGGLMGQVNRPELWLLVVCVWALQLIWSPLWLSRFDMGPFEWAWRCLTYGRRVPLLKAR